MKFAFVDEYHSPLAPGAYTAAVASVWREAALAPFRAELIESISKAINPELGIVNALPTLHAADIAQEYNDDIKLFYFETIAQFNARFRN